MGRWAVDLALSVGIFPYVLKLLQTTAPDLRQTLVFIWTKILALDRSCQVWHRIHGISMHGLLCKVSITCQQQYGDCTSLLTLSDHNPVYQDNSYASVMTMSTVWAAVPWLSNYWQPGTSSHHDDCLLTESQGWCVLLLTFFWWCWVAITMSHTLHLLHISCCRSYAYAMYPAPVALQSQLMFPIETVRHLKVLLP